MQTETITCFGGGRGQSTTLEAITLYHPRENVNSVCTSADDGGDSGRKLQVARELGLEIVPPGDLRRCMQPLANPLAQLWLPDYAEARFGENTGVTHEGLTLGSLRTNTPKQYQPRFINCPETQEVLGYTFGPEWGSLDGSCLGNIFLTVCQLKYGVQEGIDVARKIWDVQGGLAPVSLKAGHINAVYGLADQSGVEIRTNGESELDNLGNHSAYHPDMRPLDLAYLHTLPLNPRVIDFIGRSNRLVFSMGSWYTSLMANLMVDDCVGAINKANTKNILVINLFWSKGEAHHLKTASDYVEDFKERTNGLRLDRVILNDSRAMRYLPAEITRSYRAEEKQPVKGDEEERRKIHGLYPQADVRVVPLAKQLKGKTWVGHDVFLLGKNITADFNDQTAQAVSRSAAGLEIGSSAIKG